MERETKIIETPIGKDKVEVKTYLNGREKRQLTNIYLSGDIQVSLENHDVKGIKPEFMDKAQDLAWSLVVVSINGSKENIVDTILDMRSEDYDFVVAAVNDITSNKSFEQKKTA